MMGRVYSTISRYLTSKERKGGIVMSLQPRALWLDRLTKIDRAERKVPTCANIEHRPSLQTASTLFFFILIPHPTLSFLPKSEPYLLYPPFHSFWLDHQRWRGLLERRPAPSALSSSRRFQVQAFFRSSLLDIDLSNTFTSSAHLDLIHQWFRSSPVIEPISQPGLSSLDTSINLFQDLIRLLSNRLVPRQRQPTFWGASFSPMVAISLLIQQNGEN